MIVSGCRIFAKVIRALRKAKETPPVPLFIKFPQIKTRSISVEPSEGAKIGSIFRGRIGLDLNRFVKEWLSRLRAEVTYDLEGKRVFVEELVRGNPGCDLRPNVLGLLEGCYRFNGQALRPGEWTELMDGYSRLDYEEMRKMRAGEFDMIHIQMMTGNWDELTLNQFQNTLIHELWHVINPSKGWKIVNARFQEDWYLTKGWGKEIISKYGSLVSDSRFKHLPFKKRSQLT